MASVWMRGNFKANVKQDTFYFYYPSGQLETKGIYQNNLRKGIWTNYYESGKVKERLEFNNVWLTVRDSYNENGAQGVIDGNGEWRTTYDVDPTTILAIRGHLATGRRVGVWTYTLVDKTRGDSTLYCTETFKDGKFASGKLYAKNKHGQRMTVAQMYIYPELTRMKTWGEWRTSPYASKKEYPYLPIFDEGLAVDETPASFKGGLAAMSAFVGKNLHYPPEARHAGKEGSVFVAFIVNADGVIEKDSVTVLKPIYPSLDAEAVRVVKKMPPWIPATRSGKSVRSQRVMPIKFLLGL